MEIDGDILRFAALQLGTDAETIQAYAGRQQTVSEHQQRIGESLRLRAFDAAAGERLARFLEEEALRIERTAALLILACIVYWQAREISRLAAAPNFPFDPALLRHLSPIEWKNVILYGEIKIDPAKLTRNNP